jgi:hypothetical protein
MPANHNLPPTPITPPDSGEIPDETAVAETAPGTPVIPGMLRRSHLGYQAVIANFLSELEQEAA